MIRVPISTILERRVPNSAFLEQSNNVLQSSAVVTDPNNGFSAFFDHPRKGGRNKPGCSIDGSVFFNHLSGSGKRWSK